MTEAAQKHVAILLNKIQIMDTRMDKLEALVTSLQQAPPPQHVPQQEPQLPSFDVLDAISIMTIAIAGKGNALPIISLSKKITPLAEHGCMIKETV
jgi:hypothetical protein